MLAFNKFGEAVEVTEQSPYDMSHVDRKVPEASYVESSTNFDPTKTFAIDSFNQDYMKKAQQAKQLKALAFKEKVLDSYDVLDQYRNVIACDQSNKIFNAKDLLVERAAEQYNAYADFTQNEPSNISLWNDRMPSRDYPPFVPGSRFGDPMHIPPKSDVSNTPDSGQMSGADFGNTIYRGGPVPAGKSWAQVDRRGRPVAPRGGMSGAGMGDWLSDLWGQATNELDKQVDKGVDQLIQTGVQTLVREGQSAITGQPVPIQPTGTVVNVGQLPTVKPPTTAKSSIDPKYLIYGGAFLLGLTVIMVVISARR